MTIVVGKYPKYVLGATGTKVDHQSSATQIIHSSEKRGFKVKDLFFLIIITLIYFLFGKLGLQIALIHPSVSPLWAPTGIAIASFLIWGNKTWPAIFTGAFLTNLTTQGTLLTALGIATGNTLEAVIAAFFVNSFIGLEETFSKSLNVFKYTVLVVLLSTLVGASMGTMTLYLTGFVDLENYTPVWLTWWFGDAGGALVVAPLILLWKIDHRFPWNLQKTLEAILLITLLVTVNITVFTGRTTYTSGYASAFTSLPILIWIAFRFRSRETITALFVLFSIAVTGTLSGLGPFITTDLNQSLLTIQMFIGIIFLGVMPLAAESWNLRKTEAALLESIAKYKKLIETSPDAILVTDLAGNIQMVNKQTLNLYRLRNRNEIVGKSGFDFVAPEDRRKAQESLTKVIQKGVISNFEYISVRKDGTRFYSAANASVLPGPSGVPEGIIVVSHDLTQTKEVEKMKSQFVSLASHQLRTPLGSMRWSTEMLLNGDYGHLTPKLKQIMEDVYGSLLRLIALVNDLLDVSRIEEGRIADNPKQINAVEVMKKVIHDIRPVSDRKNIKIYLKTTPESTKRITIDESKLVDVFQNLLANAVKYSNKGGRVDIGLEKVNNILKATFKDSGIGIPETDRAKVFTKFYRSEEASELESEGTGLGLFIVKSYIEDWGGKIDFDSAPGKGTVFRVDIPHIQVSERGG